MRKNTKRTIFAVVIVSILFLFIYGNFFSLLTGMNYAYVSSEDPNRDYGSSWDGKTMWEPSYGRELWYGYKFSQSLVDNINSGKERITSIEMDAQISGGSRDGTFASGVYGAGSDWEVGEITYNNRPDIGTKIGKIVMPKGALNDPEDTYLTEGFESNLKNYVESELKKNETKITLVYIHEGSDSQHNFQFTSQPTINVQTEEADLWYRYSEQEDTCEEIYLFEDEITPNDYETEENCVSNIQDKDNETEEPSEPGESDSKIDYAVIITYLVIIIILALTGYIGYLFYNRYFKYK